MDTQYRPDKYDAQIERLTRNPGSIQIEWSSAMGFFAHMRAPRGPGGNHCGCLTQIASDQADLRAGKALERSMDYFNNRMVYAPRFARSCDCPELDALIKDDTRIPTDGMAITPAHLPIFAEYWRKFDAWVTTQRYPYPSTRNYTTEAYIPYQGAPIQEISQAVRDQIYHDYLVNHGRRIGVIYPATTHTAPAPVVHTPEVRQVQVPSGRRRRAVRTLQVMAGVAMVALVLLLI